MSCARSLLLARADACAQNAQITGTLKDPSGGVLPGATVTARNRGNRLDAHRRQRSGGDVSAAGPASGPLHGDRRAAGLHAPRTRRTSSLVIDQTAVVDFTLKPATVAET